MDLKVCRTDHKVTCPSSQSPAWIGPVARVAAYGTSSYWGVLPLASEDALNPCENRGDLIQKCCQVAIQPAGTCGSPRFLPDLRVVKPSTLRSLWFERVSEARLQPRPICAYCIPGASGPFRSKMKTRGSQTWDMARRKPGQAPGNSGGAWA